MNTNTRKYATVTLGAHVLTPVTIVSISDERYQPESFESAVVMRDAERGSKEQMPSAGVA
ncbi:hypothetical protein [Catenulispora pinisilvae]|uniref:hypothetical protein n=1 Tax=Catenulispora pinisilvae TaxID=2705253 RepID=UPI0018922CCF|nr:hypothetical protein [Catenulispora pinisilvae]